MEETIDPKLIARRLRLIKPVQISGLEPDILQRAADLLEGLAADATRYRWLRSMKRSEAELSYIIAGAPDCDEFIDEAMKKNPRV